MTLERLTLPINRSLADSVRYSNSSEHWSFSIHPIVFQTILKPFFILVLSGTHCFYSFIPETARASFISLHRLLAILYTLAGIFFHKFNQRPNLPRNIGELNTVQVSDLQAYSNPALLLYIF